jgi:hypothetical protein
MLLPGVEQKTLDGFTPLGPDDLRSSEISIGRFLYESSVTLKDLAKMGGGIAGFTASPPISPEQHSPRDFPRERDKGEEH